MIRAFHGARPVMVRSYYEQGLMPLDSSAVEYQVRSTLLSPQYPELTSQHIQDAISAVGSRGRAGMVFLEAKEQMLLENCAHYMLFGSKYLTGVAAQIKGSKDYRKVFLTIGSPTVFVCDVPLR